MSGKFIHQAKKQSFKKNIFCQKEKEYNRKKIKKLWYDEIKYLLDEKEKKLTIRRNLRKNINKKKGKKEIKPRKKYLNIN